jgi:hypothetical protein
VDNEITDDGVPTLVPARMVNEFAYWSYPRFGRTLA